MTFTFAADHDEAVRVGMASWRLTPSERCSKRILGFVFPLALAVLWAVTSSLVRWPFVNWLFPAAMIWFPLFAFLGIPRVMRKPRCTRPANSCSSSSPAARAGTSPSG